MCSDWDLVIDGLLCVAVCTLTCAMMDAFRYTDAQTPVPNT